MRHRFATLLATLVLVGCTSTTSPTPAVTVEPTAAEPCAFVEQSGPLFSNTLVSFEVDSDGLTDRVTFTLGDPAGPFNDAEGRLRAVEPPFIEDGSGEEVEVLGEHHLELRLDAMSLFDDAGNPTFTSEGTLKPDMLTLRQVELTGAFEGIYSFIIGYDGGGCVTLTSEEAARTLTIAISH